MSRGSRREEIRRRLLLRLFGHPISLLPTVVGTGAMLSSVLFPVDPATSLFVGVVGLVTGVTSVALRGLLGRDAITRAIVEEMDSEVADAMEARLDTLHDRLVRDSDPRTQSLLQDLRKLVEIVHTEDRWRQQTDAVVVADVLGDVDEIFERCLVDLERSVQLHETAAQIQIASTREGLAAERERIVSDVQASVEAVGTLVTQLQVIGMGGPDSGPGLDKLRRSLASTLEAATYAAKEAGGLAGESNERAARVRARIQENRS